MNYYAYFVAEIVKYKLITAEVCEHIFNKATTAGYRCPVYNPFQETVVGLRF